MDKFVSPAPPPTPYEREVTEILIEECSEVTRRATKLLRFGPIEVQPGQNLTNIQRLSLEVGDVLEMVELATRAGLVEPDWVEVGRDNKCRQLAKFMQTESPEDAAIFTAAKAFGNGTADHICVGEGCSACASSEKTEHKETCE